MSDGFFERLEQQLVATERRLAPRRRRVRLGLVIPLAIAATAVPALAATRPWEDKYAGPPGSQKLRVEAPAPGPAEETAGVLTYSTRSGLVCLAAGPVQDGRVGRFGPTGFYPLDAADAPGQCGDIAQNLADFGGIALAFGGGTVPRREPLIVYGLVASRDTRVRVTWPNGHAELARVTATDAPAELQGAEGVFAVVAAPDVDLGGTRVELLRPDGTLLHTFQM